MNKLPASNLNYGLCPIRPEVNDFIEWVGKIPFCNSIFFRSKINLIDFISKEKQQQQSKFSAIHAKRSIWMAHAEFAQQMQQCDDGGGRTKAAPVYVERRVAVRLHWRAGRNARQRRRQPKWGQSSEKKRKCFESVSTWFGKTTTTFIQKWKPHGRSTTGIPFFPADTHTSPASPTTSFTLLSNGFEKKPRSQF